MTQHAPFIHVFAGAAPDSPLRFTGVFALVLSACPAERAEPRFEEEALGRWTADRVRFINSLYAPKLGRALAFRYITAPDPDSLAGGRITIALLGRAGGSSEEDARIETQVLFEQLPSVLGGSLPAYDWETVTTPDEFEHLWNPLDWDTAHVAEVRRREELVHLETLQARPALGRGRRGSADPGPAEDRLYVVHPYIPRSNSLAAMLRAFLLHPIPIVWDTLLEPTWLSGDEEAAIVDSIGRCGRYEQARPSLAPHVTQTATVHQRRAQALSEMLLLQLLRLQDAPFVLRSAIASPAPLPRTLIEIIGVEITEPVGPDIRRGRRSDAAALLMGGYDVISPASEEEATAARHGLRTMSLSPWGPSVSPASLHRIRYLVDANEAAGVFRPPVATSEGLVGVETRLARTMMVPPEVSACSPATASPGEHLKVGENRYLGQRHDVFLNQRDRQHHMYAVGQTGTGKTTLLTSMIAADIAAGKGVTVIDPHGDLFEDLLTRIPHDRIDDVVVFDPTDDDYPVGFNLLQCRTPDDRHHVVREIRAVVERLLADEYGHKAAEYAGPVFYQHMQMNMLLVMSTPRCPGTLLDFHDLLTTSAAWKRWTPPECSDPVLERWMVKLKGSDYGRITSGTDTTMGDYMSSKFEEFAFDPRLRLIFGQRRSTIDLRRIMDEGKILLVNLAKGYLSEANSRFLGLVLMAQIQVAALSRVDQARSDRRLHYIYVDEFQSLATDNFVLLLSEGRKFGISLVLANQFVSQIKNEKILESVFGNVGTLVAFRVGQQDAAQLEPYFAPNADRFDLTHLPNWHACMRTTVKGQAVTPFTLRTVRPDDVGTDGRERAQEVRERSRQKYGRPRAEVEAEIARGPEPPPAVAPTPEAAKATDDPC